MRDTLDSSTPIVGLAWRALAVVATVLLLPPLTCIGLHNLRHPAPLGRSEAAMLQAIDAALPRGTPVDSARRFLLARGLAPEEYPPTEAPESFLRDPLFSGGPVLAVVQPATTRGVYVWNGHLTLYFDVQGRLARRAARLSAVSPL